MQRKHFLLRGSAGSLMLLCALSSPELAFAQDAEQTSAQKIDALIASLASVSGRGQDSVTENGGEIEAAILSAAALQKAARSICELTKIKAASKILILDDVSARDAEVAAAYLAQVRSLETLLTLAGTKPAQGTAPASAGDSSRGLALATIGSLTNLASALFSSETTISKISGTIADSKMLGTMISGCLKLKVSLVYDTIPDPDKNSIPLQNLDKLTGLYNSIAGIDPKARTDLQKAATQSYETFLKFLSTPVDGKMPLHSIIKTMSWSSYLESDTNILRVSIDKSGGTLLKRKNIWTGLGAPSLAITSGVIVSYKFGNINGQNEESGVIYCTTIQTTFKNVHKLSNNLVNIANCVPSYAPGEVASNIPSSRTDEQGKSGYPNRVAPAKDAMLEPGTIRRTGKKPRIAYGDMDF